ncbi:hypothetical protein C5D15_04945 [Rathayibacter toxicus]|nr:hypothetical protein C5D15_04945 [Rathayibacter toxicus]
MWDGLRSDRSGFASAACTRRPATPEVKGNLRRDFREKDAERTQAGRLDALGIWILVQWSDTVF